MVLVVLGLDGLGVMDQIISLFLEEEGGHGFRVLLTRERSRPNLLIWLPEKPLTLEAFWAPGRLGGFAELGGCGWTL